MFVGVRKQGNFPILENGVGTCPCVAVPQTSRVVIRVLSSLFSRGAGSRSAPETWWPRRPVHSLLPAVTSNSSSDPAITRHRTPLVARLGQALASAYHGLDPDPMWLGPLNATTFLSVVDDLIWMFLDGNLRHGFPLIDDCAPAARCEMPVRRAGRRHLPLNLFFVRERELVVAAIAVALLGSRITKWFDIRTPLPVPVSELDSYPFSFVRWTLRRDGRSETAERIKRWPGTCSPPFATIGLSSRICLFPTHPTIAHVVYKFSARPWVVSLQVEYNKPPLSTGWVQLDMWLGVGPSKWADRRELITLARTGLTHRICFGVGKKVIPRNPRRATFMNRERGTFRRAVG